MVFSDTTDETGIVQQLDRRCGSTSVTYPIKQKTADVNMALDRFFTVALENDANFQFDDLNQTDMPIGITDLVSGQYIYLFSSDMLSVSQVRIKDTNGAFMDALTYITPDAWRAQDIFKQPANNGGTPRFYTIIGNAIMLGDANPNYNSTGGLEVVFQRNTTRFVFGDTTKVAGIPSNFHPFLVTYAAYLFTLNKDLIKKQRQLERQIAIEEEAIATFMSNRNNTQRTRVNVRRTRSR